MRSTFNPCHDIIEKNMFLVTMRIFPNDMKKISYNSYYESSYSGFERDVRPG